MTARTAIVLLLAGFAVSILGALFKIQHWLGADLLLSLSSFIEVIAIVVIAIKVMRYPMFKDFLDS